MKNKSFKITRGLSITLFAVIGLALFMTGLTLVALLPVIGGASMAIVFPTPSTTTVETETDSGSTSSALHAWLDNDISKEITKMRPSSTPLDTILRKTGKIVPIKSWETEWYTTDVRATTDTLKTSISQTTSNTISSTNEFVPNNLSMWSIDDNILVNGIAGVGGDLVLHVVNKDTTKLYVIPLNSAETDAFDIPAISNSNRYLTRLGVAKAETDAQTTPYATFPAKSSNYCQIHMAQVEESVFMGLHKKDGDVKWDMMDYQIQSLYDMRRSMEMTSLWGVKKKFYDPVGTDWKYTSGGIYNAALAANSLGYTYNSTSGVHNITNELFLNWTKTIFTGNAGADTRFLFAGSDLMELLGSVQTIQKQIEAKQVEVVYGITFNKIETPFGILLIKHHNLFNDAYMPKNGLVLDMNNIEKHIFKPMETRELDYIKSGQKNANAYVVDETFCLAMRYQDTHAAIVCTTTT